MHDASIDVVVSNLCLHNIPQRDGRALACREIVRVLRSGGVALISDMMNSGDYAKTFRNEGLAVQRRGPWPLTTFPPLGVVMARKPDLSVYTGEFSSGKPSSRLT
ncbi:MAG: class I SAM-dependent methyltransferase [Janthinobacterium lividum]